MNDLSTEIVKSPKSPGDVKPQVEGSKEGEVDPLAIDVGVVNELKYAAEGVYSDDSVQPSDIVNCDENAKDKIEEYSLGPDKADQGNDQDTIADEQDLTNAVLNEKENSAKPNEKYEEPMEVSVPSDVALKTQEKLEEPPIIAETAHQINEKVETDNIVNKIDEPEVQIIVPEIKLIVVQKPQVEEPEPVKIIENDVEMTDVSSIHKTVDNIIDKPTLVAEKVKVIETAETTISTEEIAAVEKGLAQTEIKIKEIAESDKSVTQSAIDSVAENTFAHKKEVVTLKKENSSIPKPLQEKVVQNIPEENQAQIISNIKPDQNITEVKPVHSILEEKPVQNIIEDRPVQKIIKEKPVQNIIEDKPVQITIENKPVQNIIEDKPVQNIIEDKPVQNIIEDKPVQNIIEDKPVHNIKEEKPLQNIIEERLLHNISVQRPAQKISEEKPTQNITLAQALNLTEAKPGLQTTTDYITVENNTEVRLVQNIPEEKPRQNITLKPIQNILEERPHQNISGEKLVLNIVEDEPVQNIVELVQSIEVTPKPEMLHKIESILNSEPIRPKKSESETIQRVENLIENVTEVAKPISQVQPINGNITKDEHTKKRRASDDVDTDSPLKRLCQEVEKTFPNHDKMISEYIQNATKSNVDEIQRHTEQLLSEIQTLRELAQKKEHEWNNILHLKKVKEEILLRLLRRKQVMSFEKSADMNGSSCKDPFDYLNQAKNLAIDKSDEISGLVLKQPTAPSINPNPSPMMQTPIMPVTTHFNPMSGLPPPYDKAAHMQSMQKPVFPQSLMMPGPTMPFPREMNGQLGNFGLPMGRQGPTKDVKSIIADYRQRNPDTTPRRGRRMKSLLNPNMMNAPRQLAPKLENNLGMIFNNLDMNQKAMLERLSQMQTGSLPNGMSFKDVLVQFANIQQQSMGLAGRPEMMPRPEMQRPDGQQQRRRPDRPDRADRTPQQTHEDLQVTVKQNERVSSSSPRLPPPPPYPEISLLPVSSPSHDAQPQNSLLHGILTKNCGEITITPVQPTPPQETQPPEKTEDVVQLDDEESPPSSGSGSEGCGGGRLVIDEAAEEAPLCQGCRRRDAQFVCAGCANQWYCSRDCQVAAWDEHSEMCSG